MRMNKCTVEKDVDVNNNIDYIDYSLIIRWTHAEVSFLTGLDFHLAVSANAMISRSIIGSPLGVLVDLKKFF